MIATCLPCSEETNKRTGYLRACYWTMGYIYLPCELFIGKVLDKKNVYCSARYLENLLGINTPENSKL